ncbi:Rid family detoxifying hydrolase [Halorussus salinisoli]|uniref:Rid family detoxifying hydrolase n=1 Tax=Halorussus salinisoli TaxID=2558242 RepID=UPI0010C19327|nr:Rid family detoxifying hydrolase [Halorussus salinisoli]
MQEVTTEDAPAAIGPYSQGIVDGDRVYVSGQGPLDPKSGDVVGDDASEQTTRTLENVAAVLDAADASLSDVVKTTVFLIDMDDYEAVNETYGEYMSEPYPARSAVEVADLPVDVRVEIEAVATRR